MLWLGLGHTSLKHTRQLIAGNDTVPNSTWRSGVCTLQSAVAVSC